MMMRQKTEEVRLEAQVGGDYLLNISEQIVGVSVIAWIIILSFHSLQLILSIVMLIVYQRRFELSHYM